MKTNRLLVAAVLAGAIGAPIAGSTEEIKGQPKVSVAGGRGAAFMHLGWPSPITWEPLGMRRGQRGL
jgi:hypothetical protein